MSLLTASWRLVRRPGLLVPAAAALALVLLTTPVLDDGWALQVLRGVGVLLACAWVSATDDPAGEVVAAGPYPRHVRTLARIGTAVPPLVAVWVTAAVVVQVRVPEVPVLGLGVEALALGLLGLAVGTALRAWHDLHQPAHAAALGLVLLAFVTTTAPRWYALHQGQTWGPPWEAAQIRWAALALVAAGVVALALHDPLHRARPRGRTEPLVPALRS
ncbi:MAG TPA: hypothetical protein VFV40_02245 [Nocardioides sp.]|nr:hypothetical protein [Nocardioides sp.]